MLFLISFPIFYIEALRFNHDIDGVTLNDIGRNEHMKIRLGVYFYMYLVYACVSFRVFTVFTPNNDNDC